MTFRVVPNRPIGKRTAAAFINGPGQTGLNLLTLDSFSEEDCEAGKKLRTMRENLDLARGCPFDAAAEVPR